MLIREFGSLLFLPFSLFVSSLTGRKLTALRGDPESSSSLGPELVQRFPCTLPLALYYGCELRRTISLRRKFAQTVVDGRIPMAAYFSYAVPTRRAFVPSIAAPPYFAPPAVHLIFPP